MLIPGWKRLLSYVTEIELEHLSSDYHESLTVCLTRGRIQLYADKAIYSFEDLYTNFSEAFLRVDLKRLPGKRVLVLGLGLGSVIQILEECHHFHGEYTAVEWDEAIIYLAEKYTLSRIEAPVMTFAADAEIFLKTYNDELFDLILVDIFHDDVIPPFFSSRACLDMLKESLHPDGLLISNRLYRSAADQAETDRYSRDIFKSAFPAAGALTIEGNRVLVQDTAYLKSV